MAGAGRRSEGGRREIRALATTLSAPFPFFLNQLLAVAGFLKRPVLAPGASPPFGPFVLSFFLKLFIYLF